MAGRQSYRQVGTSMRGSLAKGPPPPIQDVIAPEPVEAYPMMRPRVKVRVRAAVCPSRATHAAGVAMLGDCTVLVCASL